MRIGYKRSVGLAVGVLLTAGMTAGAAQAAPASASGPHTAVDTAVSTAAAAEAGAPSTRASYSANVWAEVNQRSGPHTSSSLIGTLGTGDNPHTARCWVHGDLVSAEGYENDIWIYVQNKASGDWGYASAIYFKGDERGNLPASAQC